MAKRKAKDLESGVSDKTPRRSSRRRIAPEANTSNGEHVKPIDDAAPKDTKKSTQTTKKVNVKSVKEEEGSQSEEETVAKVITNLLHCQCQSRHASLVSILRCDHSKLYS